MPSRVGDGRPTMRDVAREAGVSQSLVSMVFRGLPGASQETRARILDVARAMGYTRNESARALRSQQPTAIGVVFRTRQPFHDEILDSLYSVVAGIPHDLMLSATSEARGEEAAVRELVGHRCGALILLGPRSADGDLSRWAGGVPLVVVARRSDTAGAWVVSDDRAGMTAVVDHLVGLGHRDIAYLSSPAEASGVERLGAVRDAVRAAGVQARLRVIPAGVTEDDGVAAVAEVFDGGAPPTAMIAFNDRCALGVMEALHRRGLRVPEDVSLVGYDDSSIARRPTTDLTSVRQDSTALASHAVARAVAALPQTGATGGEAVVAAEHGERGVVVPVELVVRSSSAAAPTR